MKALLLVLLIGCGGGTGGGQLDTCDPGIDEGVSCLGNATCAGGDCNDFRTCACAGGRYHCEREVLEDGASCGGLEAIQCSSEGGTACNSPPTSRGCSCVDDVWQCVASCADGCPSSRPDDGTACDLAPDTGCRYLADPDLVVCTCTGGGFVCN